MSGESATSQQDPNRKDVGSEPVIGTLVGMSKGGEPLVELDGPDGEDRRCTALTTVQIEAGMVGRPVELMRVDHLDRPVITRVIDVRAELRARWDVLGRKVLGLDPDRSKLTALVEDLRVLACTAAWLDADGCITHGAVRVGTSRRSLRVHVQRWKRHNPRLVPTPGHEQPMVERPASTTKAAPSVDADDEGAPVV
jgi:hypothetical protein